MFAEYGLYAHQCLLRIDSMYINVCCTWIPCPTMFVAHDFMYINVCCTWILCTYIYSNVCCAWIPWASMHAKNRIYAQQAIPAGEFYWNPCATHWICAQQTILPGTFYWNQCATRRILAQQTILPGTFYWNQCATLRILAQQTIYLQENCTGINVPHIESVQHFLKQFWGYKIIKSLKPK